MGVDGDPQGRPWQEQQIGWSVLSFLIQRKQNVQENHTCKWPWKKLFARYHYTYFVYTANRPRHRSYTGMGKPILYKFRHMFSLYIFLGIGSILSQHRIYTWNCGVEFLKSRERFYEKHIKTNGLELMRTTDIRHETRWADKPLHHRTVI
jgi:hypothetical protein